MGLQRYDIGLFRDNEKENRNPSRGNLRSLRVWGLRGYIGGYWYKVKGFRGVGVSGLGG